MGTGKPKARILLLTTGLALAGAETQLVQLAVRLKARGWDVRVVSMLNPQAYGELLSASGIPLRSLHMLKGRPDLRGLFRLIKLLRDWRPHILHSHMVHANLLARISRLFYRVPVQISTAHSINEGGRWRELAYRYTDFLCDITTNVSYAAVSRYLEVGAVPKGKIRLVPNGVDTKKFVPDLTSRERLRSELGVETHFVWIAVGRFEAAKDYPNLVSAFDRLKGCYPKTRLLLVGSGMLLDNIKQLVDDKGLTSMVRFLGNRSDVAKLMAAADAYVMSSAWEGLPMVLLEAASVGLPLVATNVGGNSEVVQHGKNGILVPPGDDADLSIALEEIMNMSSDKLQNFGSHGRKWVLENFDLEKTVDRWEELYLNLLSDLDRNCC